MNLPKKSWKIKIPDWNVKIIVWWMELVEFLVFRSRGECERLNSRQCRRQRPKSKDVIPTRDCSWKSGSIGFDRVVRVMWLWHECTAWTRCGPKVEQRFSLGKPLTCIVQYVMYVGLRTTTLDIPGLYINYVGLEVLHVLWRNLMEEMKVSDNRISVCTPFWLCTAGMLAKKVMIVSRMYCYLT